jgi:hypothetical protein
MPHKDPAARAEYKRNYKKRAKPAPVLVLDSDGRRRCKTEDCKTVLSRYNSDDHCAKHLPAILRKNPDVSAWLQPMSMKTS